MSSKMAAANLRYYASKGAAIYRDFSTFAQGKALATCNAAEFSRDFDGYSQPVVCEYGVGNGNFAKVFLDELKKRNPSLYSRTSYFLFDLSSKMLSAAKRALCAHAPICYFEKFDAAADLPALKFDYCRLNELLSDLPAQFYTRKGSRAVPFHAKGKCSDSSVMAFLGRIEEGRVIPFNYAAERFLLGLCKAGKEGFRIDVFDYGFYFADEIFRHPVEEWNRLMLRSYGSQLTVDLNFPHILSFLASHRIPASIEKQRDYAQRILGMPLAVYEGKKGLDYLPRKDRLEEDDGFCHLRIGR
ncbi:MAG: SAM-dependent methyltransferase [Candidatus Micrarchaeota archaeon]|nr:SAM-dependent methyltransferase [Candidatus Micrarchaeota archaeon]